MRRTVLVVPAALAVISAAAILAGAFMPWVVSIGRYGAGSENGGMLFVLLSVAPLVWAVVAVRGTPTLIQGCAALVSALLLLLALWFLTLVGLVGQGATHKEDTGTVGLGFGVANIGCLTLVIAGLARVIQALLTRRTAARPRPPTQRPAASEPRGGR